MTDIDEKLLKQIYDEVLDNTVKHIYNNERDC